MPPPYLELSLLSPEPLLSGTPIEFGWTLTNPGHAATSGDLSVLVDNVSSEVQWKVGKAAAKSTPSGSLIRARSLVVPALPRGGQFFGTLIQMELRGGAHTVRLEYRTPTGGVVASSEMELFVIDPEPVYQSQAEQRLRYYDLARYWAPVVAQDIDPYNVRADYLAAFDYDGDWAGRNNWEHLRNFELLPVVYYWVIESQDRYFIGYAFYYPRDWTSDQKTDTVAKWDVKGIQHENDLEGVLLSILKQEPEYLKGRFEAMISEAHGHFQAYVDRNMPSSSAWFATVEPSRRFQAADMDFVADDFGFHPVVYAEAEGHGAHGQPGSDVDDYPPIFMQNKITYWQGANWGGVFRPPQSHFVQNRELTGDWGDGIIYHLEAEVDHIAKANTPEESLPRHFEVVGYSLLSIQDLWDLRTDLLAFDSYGSFTGGQAQAPWGWSGGAFFNDPAALMSQLLPNWTNGPPSPPCAYTHNSFGAPEGGCPY